MEKVSIARRRRSVPPHGDPQRAYAERTHHLQLEQPARVLEGSAGPAPAGLAPGESVALSHFIAALRQGGLASRRLGFALELELDPEDPSRLKVEVIPRPVRVGRFISVKQASRLLRVSPEAVRRALARGQLQGIKIGRRWRLCLERPRWLGPGQPPQEE